MFIYLIHPALFGTHTRTRTMMCFKWTFTLINTEKDRKGQRCYKTTLLRKMREVTRSAGRQCLLRSYVLSVHIP